MNLQYYYLYMQRCFGCPDSESGLITANYASLRVGAAFDYHTMNQLLENGDYDAVECQGYQAFINELVPNFITFQRLPMPAENTNTISMGLSARNKSQGWKFHILIEDNPQNNNLARGWAIVKDELIRHQVYYTKIIRELAREQLRSEDGQSDKVITVYAFMQNKSSEEWQQFIYDVTTKLRAAGIGAGNQPNGDKAILNSQYFSYRNDGNAGNAGEDPFANINGNINLRSASISGCCK